jgi:mannan endo-1,4-beta-mannosidase
MKALLIVVACCVCLVTQAAKPRPTDPKATRETVNLYRNLLKLQYKGLMFGHQDDLPYGNGWFYEEGRSDVKDVCGDYPAVYGWELGHLELGDALSLDSVRFDKIRELIGEAYQRGGVNTISWHHRNPLTGGSAWDVTVRGVVKSVLPGGEKHGLYLQYLGKLADFLVSLKTADGNFIPVIFRPYHEHTGSWFWWGKNLCTPEEYKALWRFTVTYLRDTRNIHHLLYAYSTDRFSTREEYLERYPGDDIIDELAFDLYDRGPDYPKVLKNCAEIVSFLAREKHKIGAVSEAGGPIARQTNWWTQTLLEPLKQINLSYVLVWRNPWNKPQDAFGPFKGHPSSADFIRFYEDPETLFQKDITPLKLYR